MNRFFEKFAQTIEKEFGMYFDREEEFVECPECEEPLYNCDWESSEYMKVSSDGHVVWQCPVCGSILAVDDEPI